MPRFRFKLYGSSLWLLAAAVICAVEIYATSGRGAFSAPVVENGDDRSSETFVTDPNATLIAVGTIDRPSLGCEAAILVLSNLEAITDEATDVTLIATPISVGEPSNPDSTGSRFACGVSHSDATSSAAFRSSTRRPASQPPTVPDRRVYFLQTSISTMGIDSGHSPIPCTLMAENSRIRVYVDDRLPRDETLTELITAIDADSTSNLGNVVEQLVGPVRDVDRDGHLAVVLTPEVARLGTGQTPVDGLTSPADFRHDLDRPQGNCSDVIFLSSNLTPGDHLRAVLAHEWCHAAVFGRRQSIPGSRSSRLADDDWLNESIAHFVEVRASGSMSNLSHRIGSYLSQPGKSPLVVRDYCQPKFWRHDGCRGAAFLFLEWCLKQSDESCLQRLIDHQILGIESLEAATGRSFPELFRGWIISLGQGLADDISRAQECRLSHHSWQFDDDGKQTLKLRIRGSCAEFIRIECGHGQTHWQIAASISGARPDRLQATLIPVRQATDRR